MKKVQCNLDLVTQNLVTNRDLFSDYFAEDNFLVHIRDAARFSNPGGQAVMRWA